MHKILVIRLYFLLGALHVSDCIRASSGATFISCTSYLAYAGSISLDSTTQQPDVPAYTKCDVQFIKVAPDDGLIWPETCRASNGK